MALKKRWAVAGIGAALMLALVAGTASAQTPPQGQPWGGMMGGRGGYGGMMGGRGIQAQGQAQPQGGYICPGLGGIGVNGATAPAQPVTVNTFDDAATAVQNYLTQYGDANLKLGEMMQFDNQFYAQILEKDSGKGAMELIVELNGYVHPEMGPNMMWNTKYSPMGGRIGGMMRGFGGMMRGFGWNTNPSGAPTVSASDAVAKAQAYLDANNPGAKAQEPQEFNGYYTMDYEVNGQPAGMLSVNAFSGQVFYHFWHGTFVAEK